MFLQQQYIILKQNKVKIAISLNFLVFFPVVFGEVNFKVNLDHDVKIKSLKCSDAAK